MNFAEVLDRLGPRGACLLFSCTDEQTAQAVAKRADEPGDRSSTLCANRNPGNTRQARHRTTTGYALPSAVPAAKVKKHSKPRKH